MNRREFFGAAIALIAIAAMVALLTVSVASQATKRNPDGKVVMRLGQAGQKGSGPATGANPFDPGVS